MASFEVEEILLTFSNGNVKSFISTTTEKTSWVYQKKKSMKGELCNWVCYTNSERIFFQGAKFEKKNLLWIKTFKVVSTYFYLVDSQDRTFFKY